MVWLEALDTDGPRGEEVTAEEYALLSAHDQGAVEHFRQTVAGREILVEEETWEELPAEEQGPVRHYRHERPRVAELEVIALGDNAVGLTQRLRNRATDLFEDIVLTVSTDGLYSSFYPLRLYDPLRNRNQLLVDLGARFWIDRIRLLKRPGCPHRLPAARIGRLRRPERQPRLGGLRGAPQQGGVPAARGAIPAAGRCG